MIKLFGRMIPAAVRALTQPQVSAAQPVSSRFRVLPHDIDINMHLNNGRYMQIIDVNWMEFLIRTGVAGIILDRQGVCATKAARCEQNPPADRPVHIFGA
jgi:nicotinic acid phosphoribosyltransferase